MTESLHEKFEHHWQLKHAANAIDALAEACPQLSRQQLKSAMQKGALWLERSGAPERLRRAKRVLKVGDKLHFYFNPQVLDTEIKPARLVADHSDFTVWDKPGGMFSQGTRWSDHGALPRWAETVGLKETPKPDRQSWLVHRLDRATSGLILLAHSKQAARLLTGLFESRQVEKQYHALVAGQFPQDRVGETIEAPIDDRRAKTRILKCDYRVKDDQSLLLLGLDTGRKHQIRKHLAGLGFPILGDRLYGESDSGNSPIAVPDLALQSCFLKFDNPFTDEQLSFALEWPGSLAKL